MTNLWVIFVDWGYRTWSRPQGRFDVQDCRGMVLSGVVSPLMELSSGSFILVAHSLLALSWYSLLALSWDSLLALSWNSLLALSWDLRFRRLRRFRRFEVLEDQDVQESCTID